MKQNTNPISYKRSYEISELQFQNGLASMCVNSMDLCMKIENVVSAIPPRSSSTCLYVGTLHVCDIQILGYSWFEKKIFAENKLKLEWNRI